MSEGSVLEDRLDEFQYRFMGWSGALIQALAADGAKVSYARSWRDIVWFLWVLLPESSQSAFGTAAQVLLVAVKGEVQARDLERARIELYRSNFQLDLDLLIICDDAPNLEARLQRMPGRWGQWVPWPAARDGMPSLSEQMRQHLPRYDIFEEKNPVRGRSVIGRDQEIAELTNRIERGESAGVFGLRKVGKTSAVRAVTDALDPISAQLSQTGDVEGDKSDCRTLVSWLDVQRIYDRSAPRLFSTLADVIRKRLIAHEVSAPALSGVPIDQVNELLQFALEKQQLRMCIVLDEYDYMFGGGQGQPPIPGVSELFRMLRGWAQETNKLSIVVIGRDPLPFHRPELEGFPNPMLGWFVVRWLGPLAEPQAKELLTRLGRRVGLDIDEPTAKSAFALTGGHPLLLRQFGSGLLEEAQRHPNHEWPQPTAALAESVTKRFIERATVTVICEEIVALLSSRFSNAYDKLLNFSYRGVPKGLQRTSKGVEILTDFGLLLESDAGPWVPSVLLEYVRRREDPPWAKSNWRIKQQSGQRSGQRRRGGR
jgi:hypothetical protein